MTERFHLLQTDVERPRQFNNPFDYEPHPLCVMAKEQVCIYINKVELWQSDLAAGKMLGVLVCEDGEGCLGFLAAYSGLLAGRNDWSYFVPPVFDAQQPDGHFKVTERAISAINREVREISGRDAAAKPQPTEKEPQGLQQEQSEPQQRLLELKQRRKQMSEELQLWLFRQYRMLNARGEEKNLVDIWRDYHPSERIRARFPLPPGGTGDCCAPKLLQYAYQQGLRPLCMAESWQGASPRGEIRYHGQYYPACSGKCKPTLKWMLQGMEREEGGAERSVPPLSVIYQDPCFVVINKPAGLLSVPGRTDQPSVESILRSQFPQAEGSMMVHRLDMDTSGLMVVALTSTAYHNLQRQFLERTVHKRYVALLQCPSTPVTPAAFSPASASSCTPVAPAVPSLASTAPVSSSVSLSCRSRLCRDSRGRISLPLRPDPLDRPRQVVDPDHGKHAVTDYEVLSLEGPYPRVALVPLTGRTHQLRVHCAYPDGLGCPILGDPLYGQKADRLYLHAEQLTFRHPLTNEPLSFHEAPSF